MFSAIWASLALVATAAASALTPRASPSWPSTTNTTWSTEYWFDQPTDHSNPSSGTFKQRYWFSDEFWAGPGSPIIYLNVGAEDASFGYTYLTDAYLLRGLLELFGAAGVVVEHRYWGKSSPWTNLTTDYLKYLTVEQAVQDEVYFVGNVALPWSSGKTGGSTSPSDVPWINMGTQYSGLLAAYTQASYPGTFAAAWASSAPVQANGDYWQYWEPIWENMPQNCSVDVAAVITYIDAVFTNGTSEQITQITTQFQLQALNISDVALALTTPWSSWSTMHADYYSTFGKHPIYALCDAIETKADGTYNTDAAGVGWQLALDNWAKYYSNPNNGLNRCPGQGGNCDWQNTYDYSGSLYTNWSIDALSNRGWEWLLCTELSYFQPGDPGDSSSIVSSLLTPDYYDRICNWMFPNADGTPGSYDIQANAGKLNGEYKGWNLMASNLFVVTGAWDPWKAASVSSSQAAGYVDIPSQDIYVIPGAITSWDWYLADAYYNSDVVTAHNAGIDLLYGWLQNWYTSHSGVKSWLPPLPDKTGQWGYLTNTINTFFSGNTLAAASKTTTTLPTSTATTGSTNPNTVDKTTGEDAAVLPETAGSEADTGNSTTAASTGWSKSAGIASLVLNIVLLLALVGMTFLWLSARRRKSTGTVGLPRWQTEPSMSALDHGDNVGEYGRGRSAGGRGTYQPVQLQKEAAHVHDEDM